MLRSKQCKTILQALPTPSADVIAETDSKVLLDLEQRFKMADIDGCVPPTKNTTPAYRKLQQPTDCLAEWPGDKVICMATATVGACVLVDAVLS